MATKIVTKNSSTASAVPTASDLVQGELAVNVADKRLFTEDNAGAIVELGTNPSTLTVTGEITANGGIALGDNDKATFGAGDDLEIYHNGSNSIITETGTGNLYLGGDNLLLTNGSLSAAYLEAITGGAVNIYHNGSTKLATTSTGIDVTGNMISDGVGIGTSSPSETLHMFKATYPIFKIESTSYNGTLGIDTGNGNLVLNNVSNAGLLFNTNNTERMRIDSSGNVGIGTSSPTAKLTVSGTGVGAAIDWTNTTASTGRSYRWVSLNNGTGFAIEDLTAGSERMRVDASGNVGIGTASPSVKVDSHDNGVGLRATRLSNTDQYIEMQGGDGAGLSHINANYQMAFKTGNTERMRIDSSGRVGIGTSSPSSAKMHVETSSGSNCLKVGTAAQGVFIKATGTVIDYNASGNHAGQHAFSTGNTERMRIDSSGNLLVGQSSTATPGLNNTTTGLSLTNNGYIFASKANDNVAWFNRNTSDGSIISFRKNGLPVGSIRSISGDSIGIGNGDAGLRFVSSTNRIQPVDMDNGLNSDALTSLGDTNKRFKDLYLSGGVYLGGTGSANKLDDYEEGTWTPTLYGTATAGTATYAQRVGTYTKVGNLVYLQAYVTFSSFTGTSEMRISGLPFTPESGGYENHMGSIQLHQIALPSGTVQVNPRAVDGQTYLSFRVTTDNADSTFVSCDAAGELIISITYRSA